jgi:hypothetical protein
LTSRARADHAFALRLDALIAGLGLLRWTLGTTGMRSSAAGGLRCGIDVDAGVTLPVEGFEPVGDPAQDELRRREGWGVRA